MKKFLTMALALMMVLSLFAVPTMAATIVDELIVNGDFDSIAAGTDLTTTGSATSFYMGSNTTAEVVSIASEGIAANGTSVNALKVGNTVAGQKPEIYSNTFNLPANTAYKLSFDYYIVEPARASVGHAVRIGNNSTYGKGFYSIDGTTWKQSGDTWSYYYPADEDPDEDGTKTYVTGQWANYTVYLKSEDARSNEYVYWTMWTGVSGQANPGTIIYFDNFSLSAEVEAAAVTKTVTGNGTIKGIADVVALGTATTLTFAPAENSYLESVTIDGVDVTANVTEVFDAEANYFAYTCPITVNADTTIAATFADYYVTDMLATETMDDDYEISTAGSEEYWAVGTNSEAFFTTDGTKGNVLRVENGNARTPIRAYDLGLYKISLDAKAASTAGYIRLQHSAATSSANATWNGVNQGAFLLNITTDWESYEAYLDIRSFTSGDAESLRYLDIQQYASEPIGAYYIDNVTIQKLSETAPVTPDPTVYDVVGTTNDEAYGTVAASAATSAGEAVTFTVTPKLGYYVAAATLNGESVLGSFDAYEGGTYTVAEVAEDVELAVEFAAVTAKGENVATLPAVFAPADAAPVTFGKVLDKASATSWGIELTKDGVGVTPANGGSYLYKALATNANGQYAIEFIGLEPGEYQIRSYVYVDGTATYGAPTTFVVE